MKSLLKYVSITAVAALTVLSIYTLRQSAPVQARSAASPPVPARGALDGPMMLELYTPYCPSCRQMAPLVETLAEDCASKGVSVIQYDISSEDNEHLVEALDIDAVPTFVFFDGDGRETGRLVGKQTAEAIRAGLADIGGHTCDGRS